MNLEILRQEIADFLDFRIPDLPVSFTTHERVEEPGHIRSRISYLGDEGDQIPAYLLLPEKGEALAAILIHHQHHGQRHFGKSEVCGLVGDSWQAFGPALVRRGIAVLAPDSICFEERRPQGKGTEPHPADVSQHYNEMCYRLLRGHTLMRKVLSDSAQAISVLRAHPRVATARIGIMGHSYGGNTVLFHGALDERIRFACASGAAGSYRQKLTHEIGIEMAAVIPGFVTRFDVEDLVTCFSPRPLLLLSGTEDKPAQDADRVVSSARERCAALNVAEQIEHRLYQGGHAPTQTRFDDIVRWLVSRAEAIQS